MKVPWLAKEGITGRAQALLADYEKSTGFTVDPPIPVEDIIRNHLGLKLGYMDFEHSLGLKGVLGATYVKARLICLNEDFRKARLQGRKAFTSAHEVGHWILHRQYVKEASRLEPEANTIICRSADAKQPIEWQADFFAASLLMPEDKVREAFRTVWDEGALVITNTKSALGGTSMCVDACVENWHLIADMVCEAGGFRNVSKQAMIIRLQELGLLVNLAGKDIGWNKTSYR